MAVEKRRHDYEDEPEGYEPIEIQEHYSHAVIDFALDNFDARIAALEEIHEYNNSIADSLKKSKAKLDRTIAKGEEAGKRNVSITNNSGKKSANSIGNNRFTNPRYTR